MKLELEMEAEPLTAEQEVRLLALALKRAPKGLAELSAAQDERDVFYALPSATLAAFRLGDYAHSKALAHQALALAPSYQSDWNYGNAIHFAHTALGLLALRESDTATAAEELKKSGSTPGSPQLNSFGPSMELAKALLRAGQIDVVLDYLNYCREFWEMGHARLDVWDAKIRSGQVPNFQMNCHR
jgi:tetratricopeptide (TPR) repeat protein